jgi:hypothetical protein
MKTSPAGWAGLASKERRRFLKPRRMYEVLTTLSAFPALGHHVSIDYRTHPRDLLAQKLSLSVPVLATSYRRTNIESIG